MASIANLSTVAPAIDKAQVSKNILAALGCERALLPTIKIGSREYGLELIGVYSQVKPDPLAVNKSATTDPNRKISHYTINRIDNGAILVTLTPDKNVGLVIKKKSESVSTELVKLALESVLSPDWLIENIASGKLKAGILGIALVFSLVTFASGSDYMGQAIPISESQADEVKTEFNRCMQAIQALIALPASESIPILPASEVQIPIPNELMKKTVKNPGKKVA